MGMWSCQQPRARFCVSFDVDDLMAMENLKEICRVASIQARQVQGVRVNDAKLRVADPAGWERNSHLIDAAAGQTLSG